MKFVYSGSFLWVFIVHSLIMNGIVPPKLTLVMVLDQFAYRELQRERKSLNHGIKMLCDEGVFYHNAVMPNGLPKTGPGHAAIATGTYGKDHGIIDNDWYNQELKTFIKADEDRGEQGAILGAAAGKTHGKSAKNLKVDTLSDQLKLDPSHNYTVYALSFKDEPAIFMAGQLGKAIWFDEHAGKFTSSRAYFEKLPAWLNSWNQKHAAAVVQYLKEKMVGIKKIYYVEADQYVAGLVRACIRAHYAKLNVSPLVLWFNLSGLDQDGHFHGPESKELKARLHLLDRLVGEILHEAYDHVDKREVLVALTADHGVMPIPENIQKQGFGLAHRINTKTFKDTLNASMFKSHRIQDLVIDIGECGVTLDHAKLAGLTKEQRGDVLDVLKAQLRVQDGIQDAWTFDELQDACFGKRDVRSYLKNQLYRGRSGDIIFLVAPYILLSKYPAGTSHMSPYDYDTHIPLILYQKGVHEHKQVFNTVYAQQLPVTLAYLLGVPRPSAATMDMLPGIRKTTVQANVERSYRL